MTGEPLNLIARVRAFKMAVSMSFAYLFYWFFPISCSDPWSPKSISCKSDTLSFGIFNICEATTTRVLKKKINK